MALQSSGAWTKPAFRATAAAFGSFLAGPLGCATGAFLGGMLGDIFGKSAADFVASCAEKFGEAAAEKLLGTRLDSLANRFREHSGEIEKVYREALRESLVAIHSEVGSEFEDWFENWDACLKSTEPLDLDQVHPGELDSNSLDGILCRTMERLDAQGNARRTGSLSLQIEFRHLPDELRERIEDRLAGHFGESFRGLIVREQYQQAWRESQQVFQDWISDTLTRIDDQLKELKATIGSEFQKVLRVIDFDFLDRSKAAPTIPFLNISKGDWALVAQERAIERDLAQEVCTTLLKPHDDRAVLQCVRGEPGSGKTTLLLEIGAKLVKSGCTVLEVLPGVPLDEFRYFASKLSRNRPDRLFILIDDIYKEEYQPALIVDFLSSPGELLPITIVATTPSFADRTESIRENSFLDIMPSVSADNLTDCEIEQFRNLPGVAAYDKKLFESLLQTRRLLVVMLQLTAGKPIRQILAETAQHLKRHFPETYRAWGIVVAFGSHNLPVPSSLLNRMLGNNFFSDSLLKNPQKTGSEGILFQSPYYFQEGWFAGHVLIARYAFDTAFADTRRQVCTEALQASSPHDPEHSVFLSKMLRFLCLGHAPIASERSLAVELFRSNRDKIREIADSCPEAMVDWAIVFRTLGEVDLAVRCLLKAKPTNPTRATEVAGGLEQFGKAREALDAAEKWCASHPDDTAVRTFYLGLVERCAPKQVPSAIAQTREWLREHDEDTSVRGFYLGLVDRRAPEEAPNAIAQTREWLKAHDDDTYVRRSYLGLVDSRAPEEAPNAIAQTREWLKRHDEDTDVRRPFLGMVERCALREAPNAIADTREWLKRHDKDTTVRTFYLGMVERCALREAPNAIADTREWLKRHDEDTTVRTFYLGMVERCAKHDLDRTIDETISWLRKHPATSDIWNAAIAVLIRNKKTERVVEVTAEAIKRHPADENLADRYLGAIVSQGSEEEIATVFNQLETILPNSTRVRLRRAQWLSETGKDSEAEAAYTELIGKEPGWSNAHYAYGRHLLKSEKWGEAKEEFETALKTYSGNQMAHEGKAQALHGLASQEQKAGRSRTAKKHLHWAESHFRSAIALANKHSAQAARFHSAIGWFYLDQNRWADALSSFESAIHETAEHFSNYWGKGEALLRLGRPAEAIDALELALAKAPQPLEPPASDEIPQLLEESRKHLKN